MSDEAEDQNPVPRIVEAVFVASNSSLLSVDGVKSPLSKMIEQAMAEAVQYAYSNGLNKPEEVRELMLLARAEVKRRYALAVDEAMRNLAG
jgi:predicted RecB family endonuclease